jgi:hypothetical protein
MDDAGAFLEQVQERMRDVRPVNLGDAVMAVFV